MTIAGVRCEAETDEPYDVSTRDDHDRWCWPLGLLCVSLLLILFHDNGWDVPAVARFVWSLGGIR